MAQTEQIAKRPNIELGVVPEMDRTYEWFVNVLTMCGCTLISEPSERDVAHVQLSKEMDELLLQRALYWNYVERCQLPAEPLAIWICKKDASIPVQQFQDANPFARKPEIIQTNHPWVARLQTWLLDQHRVVRRTDPNVSSLRVSLLCVIDGMGGSPFQTWGIFRYDPFLGSGCWLDQGARYEVRAFFEKKSPSLSRDWKQLLDASFFAFQTMLMKQIQQTMDTWREETNRVWSEEWALFDALHGGKQRTTLSDSELSPCDTFQFGIHSEQHWREMIQKDHSEQLRYAWQFAPRIEVSVRMVTISEPYFSG